jgi:hypothetical protein
MSPSPYADPQALRSATADRLRPLADERGIQLTNLQRQFAYDRLLCRVFTGEPGRWVLKGGTAMLARIGPEARHTRDVDLLSREGGLQEAERALHAAARLDLEDFFTCTLASSQYLTDGVHALRVPVDAHLGLKRFARDRDICFRCYRIRDRKRMRACSFLAGRFLNEGIGRRGDSSGIPSVNSRSLPPGVLTVRFQLAVAHCDEPHRDDTSHRPATSSRLSWYLPSDTIFASGAPCSVVGSLAISEKIPVASCPSTVK